MQEAVANLGLRPTVSGSGVKTLEVHFLDYSGDLYGKELKVELGKCLRPEMKFSGIDELKAQISSDCDEARLLLSENMAWYS